MNSTTIKEVLEVPYVFNLEYKANIRDMDLEYLPNTIVDPTK